MCVSVCFRAHRKWQQQQREAEKWEEEIKYQVIDKTLTKLCVRAIILLFYHQ